MLPPPPALPEELPPDLQLQVELFRRNIGLLPREHLETMAIQLMDQCLYHQRMLALVLEAWGSR